MKHIQLSMSADDNYRRARIQRTKHLNFIQATGLTTNKQTRFCRQHAVGEVLIKKGYTPKGIARSHFRGLVTCKSIWACPECAYGQALVRQERINNLLRDLPKTGAHLLFVTFTVQHHYANTLEHSLDILQSSLKNFQQGAGYYQIKRVLGLVGIIRVLEITHGHNGWNPHLHCVFVVEKETTTAFTKEAKEMIFDRWAMVVKRNGGYTNSQAIDVKRVYSDSPLANYLSKLAQELTQSITKKGRRGSRTPFAILADLYNSENKRPVCSCKYYLVDGTPNIKSKCDLCLYVDYEATMKGRRQIGFSGARELEKRCESLDKEADDSEFDNILMTKIEKFASLDNATYKIIRQNRIGHLVLEASENGVKEFKAFMDNYTYEIIYDDGEVVDCIGLDYTLLTNE
jgi:hypothetical protein